jgi:hypothetical protein
MDSMGYQAEMIKEVGLSGVDLTRFHGLMKLSLSIGSKWKI